MDKSQISDWLEEIKNNINPDFIKEDNFSATYQVAANIEFIKKDEQHNISTVTLAYEILKDIHDIHRLAGDIFEKLYTVGNFSVIRNGSSEYEII